MQVTTAAHALHMGRVGRLAVSSYRTSTVLLNAVLEYRVQVAL